MGKNTALVMIAAIVGIVVIVVSLAALGYNSSLGYAGISSLSGCLVGSGAYFLGRRKAK